MIEHEVRVHPSTDRLSRTEQLAWKLAEIAAEPVEPEPDVVGMVVNRVVDAVAVATAALARHAPTKARAQARRHPSPGRGATVFVVCSAWPIAA